jgi:hypothetical protein
MSATRMTVTGADVQVGDRVFARGLEMTVTRIDEAMFGNPDLLALVEDSGTQWLKMPAMKDAEIEIERA